MLLSTRDLNRRTFLTQSTAAAAAAFVYPIGARAAESKEKANLAAVGVGGKGWGDITSSAEGHNVIAFCDVETGKPRRKRGGFAAAAEKWPRARRYNDWRKMLDEEHKHLDGVTVSTPDHMHAPVTMAAINRGLGTYTQKPLTRTVFEARQLRLAASKAGVVTQMGNQGHSSVQYRSLVKLIQDGAIGKIKEAHAWSDRPKWPQGIDRPSGNDPVPSTFHWDLWLGGAPEQPFLKGAYHPFKWRGWRDYGAGALGDMGCHIIDPVVWSLELGPPKTVAYEGPKPSPDTFPEWELIHYDFPGTKYTTGETIRVIWYDGGKLPPAELAPLPEGEQLPTNGTLFIGEKGVLLTRHVGTPQLLPVEKFADYELPNLEKVDHYLQWSNSLVGVGKTTSHFDYAGPLTETVLLGTVAARFPNEKLQWDSKGLRVTNLAQANEFIKQPYRKGWQIEGLT